jgi:hypothetical protein
MEWKAPQVSLPLYVITFENFLIGYLGFLTPIIEGFHLIDSIIEAQDTEVLLLLPDIQYKKTVEDWLIATHKPMLTNLVSEFVTVSNVIPRDPVKIISKNAERTEDIFNPIVRGPIQYGS